MHLHSLYLKNFRNHEEVRLTFSPKVNLILGLNGIGKTNLLEAIYLISTGRSFRAVRLEDLIMQGKSFFYIEAQIYKENVLQTLKIGFNKNQKKIEYNSSPLSSFSDLLGIVPSVLYAPKDISLIMGSPEERRKFLNMTLSQNDPLYVHHLTRYHKALESRNALLKHKTDRSIDLECFEKQLSTSASYLMQKRDKFLKSLQTHIERFVIKLTPLKEIFSLEYDPSCLPTDCALEVHLFNEYQKLRAKEKILGTTLIGPHRDDFKILEKALPAKTFCSEGQKRSFLNALKFSEWEIIKTKHGFKPLMCLDDLAAHLDHSRHTLLKEALKGLGQIFITSTEDVFGMNEVSEMKTFHLKD